jgi:hypothetical protein
MMAATKRACLEANFRQFDSVFKYLESQRQSKLEIMDIIYRKWICCFRVSSDNVTSEKTKI